MTQTSDDAARRALDAAGLGPDARIGVAVSGGPDSVAAWALLAERSARGLCGPVVALHVDHGLRAESAAEADAVRAMAKLVGAPCVVRRVDVGRVRPGRSFEAAARAARYAAFAEAADAHAWTHLVVAHHREDRVESTLLALLRGGGWSALAGPPAARPLTPRCRLVRPFLDVARDSLRAASARLPTLDDPTNRDRAILRNAVRLDLLPRLRAARRDVDALLLALADDARVVAEAATRVAERLRAPPSTYVEPGLVAAAGGPLDAAGVLARARFWLDVFAADAAFGGPASEGVLATLEAAAAAARAGELRVAEARRGVRAVAAEGRVELDAAAAFEPASRILDAADPAPTRVPAGPGRTVVVRPAAPAEAPASDDPRACLLDAGPRLVLEVRPARPGDAYALESGAGRGKAAETLRAAGLSPAWRSRIPFVFMDGALRWIPGIRRVGGVGTTRWELRLEGPAPWLPRPGATREDAGPPGAARPSVT